MTALPIEDLEKKIGYSFQDKTLIVTALTHSSTGPGANYQRLEFLGDRVLGLIVALELYHKFPDEPEGDMAKRLASLVQGSLLARVSSKINLGAFINFSDAERDSGGGKNEHILADVFEAVLGALYLDSGFDVCQRLVKEVLADDFYTMKEPPQHPKTALQEWAQAKGLPLPKYDIIKQHGPDHAPVFDISLVVQGYVPVQSQGRSRQEAEKSVALLFLDHLETIGEL